MSLPKLAAIDVGSNAMRLAVATADENGRMHVIHTDREAVRLGADVFARREISDSRLVEAMDAFLKFRKVIRHYKVKQVRAVGTSALREARNRDYCIDQILKTTGLTIEAISAEEEARLVYLAVARAVKLDGKVALLLDIGGGSVEVSLVTDGGIITTESFNIGTVRLLQMLEEKKRGERVFRQLAREYINVAGTRLKKEIGERTVDMCIATGGNVESVGDLRVQLCDADDDTSVTIEELDSILKQLQSRSYEDRIRDFGLRSDRADVIIPAIIVLQIVSKEVSVREIKIPHVGVREGLLFDMAQHLNSAVAPVQRTQLITSAQLVGRKYDYDAQHAQAVARFAVTLFDATRKLHKLGSDERVLLEAAALLHDIGYYIGMANHGKHSLYLINASPLIGVDDSEKSVIALIARYHSGSLPKPSHKEFMALSPNRREIVLKLAVLLRLAEALDREHGSKVGSFSLIIRKRKVILRLKGQGDLLLEKWALGFGATFFEKIYKRKMVVE
jgi:exopolyphosphatase/guanosine-5'-triphosphate,3'-diphosphate pyrophosphatase